MPDWDIVKLCEPHDPIGYCGLIVTSISDDGMPHVEFVVSKYGVPWDTPHSATGAIRNREWMWTRGERVEGKRIYIIGIAQSGLSNMLFDLVSRLKASEGKD